jgi:uncharacterized protein YlxW (UPF0749 family)
VATLRQQLEEERQRGAELEAIRSETEAQQLSLQQRITELETALAEATRAVIGGDAGLQHSQSDALKEEIAKLAQVIINSLAR